MLKIYDILVINFVTVYVSIVAIFEFLCVLCAYSIQYLLQ